MSARSPQTWGRDVSTNWDVWCEDCSDKLGMDNCTSEDSAWLLARNADAIAVFSEAQEALKEVRWDCEADLTRCGRIVDTAWFVRHRGHRLVPKNEYGRLATQCHAHVKCSACGHTQHCKRGRGHDGEHSATR